MPERIRLRDGVGMTTDADQHWIFKTEASHEGVKAKLIFCDEVARFDGAESEMSFDELMQFEAK